MLTKDEIDALIKKHSVPGHATLVACHDLINDAIAAHTRKVLEDVEPVAKTFFDGLLYSATTVAALKSERDTLAARIDALMLEHCPDEMTEAQKAEWAAHQKPAENAALATALAACRDSFPVPSPGSASENAWGAAIADPGSVPAYVAARVAELDGVLKDVERWWLTQADKSEGAPACMFAARAAIANHNVVTTTDWEYECRLALSHLADDDTPPNVKNALKVLRAAVNSPDINCTTEAP